MGDSLHERGEAVENVFFAQRDQQLLKKLRAEMAAEEERDALTAATGISDAAVLDSLIEHKISPATMTVIGLVPMVAVAWSDGSIEEAERAAILQAADISGVRTGTAAFELLQAWLIEQPPADLLESWKSYVTALRSSVDADAMQQLKTRVMDRAEKVASAAGGFLGLGNKVSDAEQKVLDELNRTFS